MPKRCKNNGTGSDVMCSATGMGVSTRIPCRFQPVQTGRPSAMCFVAPFYWAVCEMDSGRSSVLHNAWPELTVQVHELHYLWPFIPSASFFTCVCVDKGFPFTNSNLLTGEWTCRVSPFTPSIHRVNTRKECCHTFVM